MKRIYAVIMVSLSLALCVLASCISREDAQNRLPSDETYHAVTFYDGSMILQQTSVRDGETIAQYPEGYSWCDSSGKSVDPAATVVTQDMDLYVRTAVQMLGGHVRFLRGEGDFFRPDEYLTRAEAAGIVRAFLDPNAAAEDQAPDSGMTVQPIAAAVTQSSVQFTDVAADSDYAADVQFAADAQIMNGYADGTFRPDVPITRSEMLALLCRLTNTEEMTALAFPDVTVEDWSMGCVAAAVANGWVAGYEDGNFYPDNPITRAEAVVMVNRAIGRTPSKTAIDQLCAHSPYRDLSRRHWAYYDIVDVALNSELMAYILGEVENVQPGFIILDGQLCHVNPETLRLDAFAAGFHTITDGLPTDGLYYAEEDGYFLQRNVPGLKEMDGSMFYVEAADGPFVTNYTLGYLQFGENGRYTSGDAEVDALVNEIMDPIIQGKTENLLSETKLREAYNAIVYGGYRYLNRGTGWIRGSTKWTLETAKVMYQTKRGTCFYWAASFLYLARRLGFQAYPISGGVGTDNRAHAWVMIDDEYGNEYIYDAELDWAYRTNYYHLGTGAMDMFKQLRGHAHVLYIFPGDTYSVPPSDEELLEDSPNIIWPSELFGSAYIEVDGAMVMMNTMWEPLLDEMGNIIGYSVTAMYEGATYTYMYSLYTDPGELPPDVDATPEPGWEGEDPDTEASPDPDTEASPDPGTQSSPEPGTESSPEPGTQSSPEPGTESSPDPDTQASPDPGAQSSPGTSTETNTPEPEQATQKPVETPAQGGDMDDDDDGGGED